MLEVRVGQITADEWGVVSLPTRCPWLTRLRASVTITPLRLGIVNQPTASVGGLRKKARTILVWTRNGYEILERGEGSHHAGDPGRVQTSLPAGDHRRGGRRRRHPAGVPRAGPQPGAGGRRPPVPCG